MHAACALHAKRNQSKIVQALRGGLQQPPPRRWDITRAYIGLAAGWKVEVSGTGVQRSWKVRICIANDSHNPNNHTAVLHFPCGGGV